MAASGGPRTDLPSPETESDAQRFTEVLESMATAFIKPGRHRYVRIDDLIRYAESLRARRAEDLDQLAREADKDGLYEKLDGPHLSCGEPCTFPSFSTRMSYFPCR